MPIYSTWLTNIATSVYAAPFKSNQGTVSSWYINYDDLFRYENYKYNKCRLRIKMVSNVTGSSTFQGTQGYIGCNLISNTNSTNTLNPTPINLFVLVDCLLTSTRLTNAISTNTAEGQGTNISVPTGSGLFTITIGDMLDFTSLLSLTSTSENYQIHLMFELYDPIIPL